MRFSWLIFAAFVAVAPGFTACGKKSAPAAAPAVYTTKGTIKKLGPDNKFVSIAHEDIPNYMDAMTMTFEPSSATQLAGLAEGDAVSFSFTATDDGKRILQSIKKSP